MFTVCNPCLSRQDSSCIYAEEHKARRRRRESASKPNNIKKALATQAPSARSVSSSASSTPFPVRIQNPAKRRNLDSLAITPSPEERGGLYPDKDTPSTSDVNHAIKARRQSVKGSVSHDADVMTGMVGDPARSVEFFGTSSAGSFLREINSAIDARLGHSAQLSTPWDLDTRSTSASTNTVARILDKQDPQDYTLPFRKHADELLDSYYDLVWAILPIHEKLPFDEAYKAVWLGLTPTMHERTLFCLINMTFALGSQFSESVDPVQRREVGQAFWKRAKKLLGGHTHSASIEQVQCMLMMGLYLQSTCETYECWMTIGSAIRMAQSLGLHLSNSMTSVSGSREVEMARRVWHGCVFMDR